MRVIRVLHNLPNVLELQRLLMTKYKRLLDPEAAKRITIKEAVGKSELRLNLKTIRMYIIIYQW